MKKFAIAALALAATSAQASTYVGYKCTTTRSAKSYLLMVDFSGGDAMIFAQSAEFEDRWEPLFKSARAITAMDGGPVLVTGADESVIDWSQEPTCLRFRPTYRFQLKLSSRGTTGTLEVLPKVVVNPAVPNCPVPHIMPAPAQDLTCVNL